jgi:hypothetical protein
VIKSLKLRGVPEMQKAIADVAKQYPEQVRGAVYRMAERVMTDCKENYVVVDTGNLKNSGHVEKQEGRIAADIVFGGPVGSGGANERDANYAVIVHETPMEHRVGVYEYLKRALMAAVDDFKRNLIAECQFGKR